MLALLAAIPIAVLPATSREVPAEAVRQAEGALRSAMPPPYEPAKFPMLEEHLAAAGPSCRADPQCVCSAVPLEAGAKALELEVERLSARAWAADLRLLAPCENELIDRKAAVIDAGAAALSRFAAEAAAALLRGRDLGPLRWSGAADSYDQGMALLQVRAWAAAEAELDRVIQVTPEHAGALSGRGWARLGLARPAAAAADFAIAQKLDPSASMPLYGLAEASRQLGHADVAVRHYRAYLALPEGRTTPELRAEAAKWIQALERSQ
ncbi:MAG: hypothetical protein ACXWLM_11375 [Myxococcales bacterium]